MRALAMNPATIKGTVGSGGIGILMLSIASLDALHVHFWVAFGAALLPALVFILGSDGSRPGKSTDIALGLAAGWYFLLALLSLSIALWRGFAWFDAFFLGFVLLGAWPCTLVLRNLSGGAQASRDDDGKAILAARRAAAARAERGGALEFGANRRKAALLLAGCAGFVALGAWAVAENPWLGWTCIAFFGLGIPVSLLTMLPGSTYLRIDGQGFEMASLYRRHRVRWEEVDGFGLASVGGNRMIAIAYSDDYRRQRAMRRFSLRLTGVEAAIPDHYAAPVEQIIEALCAWKSRFGRQESRVPMQHSTGDD